MVFYHLRVLSQSDNSNIIIHNNDSLDSQIMVLKRVIVKMNTANTAQAIVLKIPWLNVNTVYNIDNNNDSGLTIPLPSNGSLSDDYFSIDFDLALKTHTVIPRDFTIGVYTDNGAGTVSVCHATNVFKTIDMYFNYSSI